uniref:Macro domain-containing protein n=1 Tax=Branchiostoma floridae TaxID=7739 RepID=C3YRY5_BRAFL|eukprot:XP_002600878.1 hypothetical protein BRAFLDRAFT_75837 [Branchiostoma floridae]
MSTCLKHADKDSERTIAFPAVGTGGLGYPKDVVARLMFEETLSHSRNNPAGDLEKAKFVVYDQLNFEAFLSELGKHTDIVAGTGSLMDPTSSCTAPVTEDDDVATIQQKALERDVYMEICNDGKKIRLQGLAEDILVLQSEIHQILARVMNEGKQQEHAQLIARIVKWVYVDNGTEVEFDRLTNLKIEYALDEGHNRVRVDVDDVGECLAHIGNNILVTVQEGHRYKLKRKAKRYFGIRKLFMLTRCPAQRKFTLSKTASILGDKSTQQRPAPSTDNSLAAPRQTILPGRLGKATEKIKQLQETNGDLKKENEELRKLKWPISDPKEVPTLEEQTAIIHRASRNNAANDYAIKLAWCKDRASSILLEDDWFSFNIQERLAAVLDTTTTHASSIPTWRTFFVQFGVTNQDLESVNTRSVNSPSLALFCVLETRNTMYKHTVKTVLEILHNLKLYDAANFLCDELLKDSLFS